MKTKDLVLGQDYYLARGNNWETGYGYGRSRVRVVDLQGWVDGRTSTWSRPDTRTVTAQDGEVYETTARPRAKYDNAAEVGPLVVDVDEKTGDVREGARARKVALSTIRAPWETAVGVIAARQAQETAARRAKQEREDADTARRTRLSEGLAEHGLTLPAYGVREDALGIVEALLERLNAALRDAA